MGGGVPARLCEARRSPRMGAHATAAQLLTNLAANPNRAMSAGLRAVVLTDGARQWLAAGRPDLARAALAEAGQHHRRPTPTASSCSPASPPPRPTGPPPAPRSTRRLAARPDDALAHALLAAALRNQGDPAAALAEAERARALDPDLPEALFETGAALAETGETATAPRRSGSQLIAAHPDSDARRARPRQPAAAQLSRATAQAPASRHHRIGVRRQPPRHRQRAPGSPELPIA